MVLTIISHCSHRLHQDLHHNYHHRRRCRQHLRYQLVMSTPAINIIIVIDQSLSQGFLNQLYYSILYLSSGCIRYVLESKADI